MATKLMSYKIARYGWLPDLPDQRDHFYAAPVELAGGIAGARLICARNARRFMTRASSAVAPPTPSPEPSSLTG